MTRPRAIDDSALPPVRRVAFLDDRIERSRDIIAYGSVALWIVIGIFVVQWALG